MESEKEETYQDLIKTIEHLRHENERLERQFDAATNELVKWNKEAIENQKKSFLQSRISSLEAALSLDDERIEKIASEMYGVPIDRAPSSIARMYRSHAITAIKELRELAGLEVSDGE